MQHKPQPAKETRRYRLFEDAGHGWLEVPRRDVVASGIAVSAYSYYDPVTDMAYLEHDCDATAYMAAVFDEVRIVIKEISSSMPRRLPSYEYGVARHNAAKRFIDIHIFVVRPNGGTKRAQ